MEKSYTIGIDFGTDSVRAILVDANGILVTEAEAFYKRWNKGDYCNPNENQFRQHPLDHLESLKQIFSIISETASKTVLSNVKAISVASTGSTPVAVNRKGTPLSLTPGFEENPNAMFILWKDHTSVKEAKEINALAHSGRFMDYTKYSGGEYSSEWFWAKILHMLRIDGSVKNSAYSWIEHCDWITALLIGNTDPLQIKRSRCAAGHKAMWHSEWEGLPSSEFLREIDPLLEGLRERLYNNTFTMDQPAGILSKEWAELGRLPSDVVVGVGGLDAHMGAIGGEIEPNYLVKVIGTSTCDLVVVPKKRLEGKVVEGICGQVDGSILPDMMGLEAGQSAFGDIYAWFRDLLLWPVNNILTQTPILDDSTKSKVLKDINKNTLRMLGESAKSLPLGTSSPMALDWMNGRRTPDSDNTLTGALIGLSLSTDAPSLFRAMVEATCFGSKKILDRFKESGIQIDGIIAMGGVAQKSDFVMQTLADILDFPIKVVASHQACALGAAMSAAVVVGLHVSYKEAQENMGSGFDLEYRPNPKNVEYYSKLYNSYSNLADFVEKEHKNSYGEEESP